MILLDLFCGAGGAAVGYSRAGFEVIGVDLYPQPNYPFKFIQMDAFEFMDTWNPDDYDFYHASPPCQKYSNLQNLGKQDHMERVDFIAEIRTRFAALNKPTVIENVVGSPLINPVRLCGSNFGLKVRRHRLFEVNFPVRQIPCTHPKPSITPSIGIYGDHPQVSKKMNRAHTLEQGQEAMGIDWMTWKEMCEAVPPAYTEYIGQEYLWRL
jgi:DNA (cytosine-5)-methyltransferase 1